MKTEFLIDVVVPMWNEEKNVDIFVNMFNDSKLMGSKFNQLVIVNNGSTDTTYKLLKNKEKDLPWLKIVSLENNDNYGGGIYQGMKFTKTKFVAYMPGDMQVEIDDLEKLYSQLESLKFPERVLIKGKRIIRFDPLQTRIVSKVYTYIVNLILGLKIKDINGLPKLFDSSLLNYLPNSMVKTFVFDAQILAAANFNDFEIIEIPVTFHARRLGVSSWSGKRVKTYIDALKLVFTIRNHSYNFNSEYKRSLD